MFVANVLDLVFENFFPQLKEFNGKTPCKNPGKNLK